MAVKVYIWYPKAFRSSGLSALTFSDVGHVSMQINNIYISHRPSLENNINTDISYRPILENNNARTHLIEYALQSLLSSESDSIKVEDVSPVQISEKDTTKKYVNVDLVPSADSTNYSYYQECKDKGRQADRTIELADFNEHKMLTYYQTVQGSMYHAISNNCSTFIANVIRSSLDCSSELCAFCSLRDKGEIKNKHLVVASLIVGGVAIAVTGGLSTPALLSIAGGSVLGRIPVWTPTLIEEFIELLKEDFKKNSLTLMTTKCLNASADYNTDTAIEEVKNDIAAIVIQKLHSSELHDINFAVNKLVSSNPIDDVVDGINAVFKDAVNSIINLGKYF
ncbi:hypothetical protein [Nostoc sp. DSM 114167]|uniref:hypothetical protein n=1 Tax=Nostoc sp. DSM 114167 TaxID=3439050 RepID=UPI004045BFBB